MTSSMMKSHNIFEEDCYVDRISNLPRNVIDCIMEFMPVRDAARTCVLSSKWRYVWADHPSLVLDDDFWDAIQQSRSTSKLRIDYADIVGSILLYHVGYIKKFIIDVSLADSVPDFKIDLWLSFLCRRRLNELYIENSEPRNLYKVPSFVFSTSELTDLSLTHCIVKPKGTLGCFTNIWSLFLEDVTLELDSMVLTTPLLTSLTLESCRGVRDFNISAPRLASLTLRENDYLNLKPFLTCKDINDALLYSTDDNENCESINLLDLLAAWPRISALVVDGFCFEYLATGTVPDIPKLNLREFTLYEMDLDLEQIAWILCILKNSPLLCTFEICFSTTDLEEVNGVDEPPHIRMNYRIKQLHTIKMKYFTASRVQVMFAKILLQCTPRLRIMLVDENAEIDHNERINILKCLLVLQRASSKAQILFGPNLVLP